MHSAAFQNRERPGRRQSVISLRVAAGETLGILIPPSAGLVVYAILTEESIGRLFSLLLADCAVSKHRHAAAQRDVWLKRASVIR